MCYCCYFPTVATCLASPQDCLKLWKEEGELEWMKWWNEAVFVNPVDYVRERLFGAQWKKRFPLHCLKPHSSRLLNCPRDTISPTIYHWLSVKTPPCSRGSSDACLLLLTVCVYIQQEFPALTVWAFRWSFLSLPGWFCLALRRSDYIKPLRELYRSWTSLCVCLVCLY